MFIYFLIMFFGSLGISWKLNMSYSYVSDAME